jgi:large subunit ribosomal protein L23
MAPISPQQILLKPVITERSLLDQARNRYRFLVSRKSTKSQIVAAFKQAFGVVPQKVNTLTVKGKQKTDWKRRQPISKPDRKIAIITLLLDQKLELLTVKTK